MTSMQICQFQSPVGILQVESDGEFISSVKFLAQGEMDYICDSDSPVLQECKKELLEYFEGSRKSFSVEVKPEGSEFEISVWDELKKIPFGSTISYEELALRLGDLKKIRAAARANGKNPLPIIIPCHRVIGKDGNLVGFAGGLDRKEWLLSHEGSIARQFSLF